MANKGPYVNAAGANKQAIRMYNMVGSTRSRVKAIWCKKPNGAWHETKLILHSSLAIGLRTSGSESVGYDVSFGYGSMGAPSIGWDTVISTVIADKNLSNLRTRFMLSIGSVRLPMSFTQTRAISVEIIDQSGNRVSGVLRNSSDAGPFSYWEIGDGQESLAIFNWMRARVNTWVTIIGML